MKTSYSTSIVFACSRLTLIAILLFCTGLMNGQDILNQYVQQAIENNLGVREKKTQERISELQLETASRLYTPEVQLMANYTLAAGGRSIDFPIGSLLNPVYTTLNDITETQNFSLVENETVQFLPNNFYDAKLRITQPILRPEIKYNKWIKTEEVKLSTLQTSQAVRDLVRDVKTSYLRWMQAREVIGILEQGAELLVENKRITESLIKNGLAIPSARIRIESDIAVLNAQLQKASADLKNAASHFNFLLHQPSETQILTDTFTELPAIPVMTDLSTREELLQIKTGEKIQSLALSLEKKHFAPKLGLQLDLGSQSYGFDWGGYALGGVQLEIPIWDNKKSNLRQQEWEAKIEANELTYDLTKDALELQLHSEIENLAADISIYHSYTALLASNDRYYHETVKRYKEGLANYIELLDARTQVTSTQLQQNVSKYQSWIRQINIERIAASAIIE